jgi:nitroreductase
VTVLEAIKTRRSIAKFRPDPLPRDLLEQMLDAAVWAPNHRLTEPWRFYVLTDEGKRRYAEIRRQSRAAGFADPHAPEAEKALERLHHDILGIPAFIVVTSQVVDEEVQREEDIAATFMAAQNLMLAGVELGVGTYLRTGPIIHDPELRGLLNLEDDRRILAIISAGYASAIPQKRRTPAAERTVWL